jgi:ribonuclease R
VGLEEAKQGRAHHLVEEFMLAANAAVAAELVARGIPGLFRCHAAPGPRDLEEFRALARDLGLKTGDLDSRSGINRFLAGITRDPVARVLGLALLRALPRADYRVAPALHFGLGKECYCHFTSPIRRYADLLVHQQLWAADTGAAVRSHDECETLGETVTGREAETDEAYFAASDRLKLRYLLQQMNDHGIASHEAVVLRVYKQELLLYMVDVGVFARLPARLVSGMGWRVDSLGANGRASAGGMEFRSGSVLYVVPHRVDVVKGDLTVRLAT